MHESQLQGIVRIEIAGALPSRGTGFIVRIDGDHTDLLTALHVVADRDRSRETGAPAWLGESATLRFMAEANFRDAEGFEPRLFLRDVVSCDVSADWVLLRYQGKRPAKASAMHLAALEDRAGPRAWETFGFTDADPDQGEPHSGWVELHHDGEIRLFSQQAAAGQGGQLAGLSGAPCVSEGHVVGLIGETLQQDGLTIHGCALACDIRRIVEGTTGLQLAPGPPPFQAEMELQLRSLSGSSLLAVAQSLKVPLTESESGLRVWIARALLLAEKKDLITALRKYPSAFDLEVMVEMALACRLRSEAVGRLHACITKGSPRGLVAVAKSGLIARLLVARALGEFERARQHCCYVENPAATNETWSRKVREALEAALLLGPGDSSSEEELMSHLRESDLDPFVIAFPFDAQSHPLDTIEHYQNVRALPLVYPKAGTFQRDRYEVEHPLEAINTEDELLKTRREVLSYAPRKG